MQGVPPESIGFSFSTHPGPVLVVAKAEGRADVLIAFRLCRQDEDGSSIILWRLLKKTSAPFLK
jgi:hypothetical protein